MRNCCCQATIEWPVGYVTRRCVVYSVVMLKVLFVYILAHPTDWHVYDSLGW
jgi:hypothetical protein